MSLSLTCTCGQKMRVANAHAGLHARCPACGAVKLVPGKAIKAEPQEPADASIPEGSAIDSAKATVPESFVCAACGETVGAREGVFCIACHAPHHPACWQTGCSVPTCEAGPRSRRRVMRLNETREQMRPCPKCAERIPERAQRCRYCGVFLDPDLRKASRKRFEYPRKTSYLAGISVLLGLIGLIFISLTDSKAILLLWVALPLTAFGLGSWALYDIHKSAGEKSGWWMAGGGLFLASIALLTWLVAFLP